MLNSTNRNLIVAIAICVLMLLASLIGTLLSARLEWSLYRQQAQVTSNFSGNLAIRQVQRVVAPLIFLIQFAFIMAPIFKLDWTSSETLKRELPSNMSWATFLALTTLPMRQ